MNKFRYFFLTSFLLFSNCFCSSDYLNVIELQSYCPATNQILYEIRDGNKSINRRGYKLRIRNLSKILCIEAYRKFETERRTIQTHQRVHCGQDVVTEDVVIISVMNKGNCFLEGAQEIFPNMKIGFLHYEYFDESRITQITFMDIPNIENKNVIFIQPEIGKGYQTIFTLKRILERNPKQVVIVSGCAYKGGIEKIKETLKELKIKVDLVIASKDSAMDGMGNILPGIGNIMLRAYGRNTDNL